jgi:hypothetical protein
MMLRAVISVNMGDYRISCIVSQWSDVQVTVSTLQQMGVSWPREFSSMGPEYAPEACVLESMGTFWFSAAFLPPFLGTVQIGGVQPNNLPFQW